MGGGGRGKKEKGKKEGEEGEEGEEEERKREGGNWRESYHQPEAVGEAPKGQV